MYVRVAIWPRYDNLPQNDASDSHLPKLPIVNPAWTGMHVLEEPLRQFAQISYVFRQISCASHTRAIVAAAPRCVARTRTACSGQPYVHRARLQLALIAQAGDELP